MSVVAATKRTVRPSGKIVGKRCVRSWWSVSSVVMRSGVPPLAGTRHSGSFPPGVKMIVPSGPHAAPRGLTASQILTGAPPSRATCFNWLAAKKPRCCPSGEKNGPSAPSVPRTNVASARSSGRT